MKVLVVEDKPAIRQFLRQGLSEHGLQVDEAHDGESALSAARAGSFDVIVLDLMLPGLSGLDVLQQLRATGDPTPVLCLTARDSLDDKVRGLNLGADDYLTKPFSFAELVARVFALLRRGRTVRPVQWEIGDLEIDVASHSVKRRGRRIELTSREFALLVFLAEQAGQVVSRGMIMNRVWGENSSARTNVIDVHVNKIRRKIDDGRTSSMIETIRGVGYRLIHESPS